MNDTNATNATLLKTAEKKKLMLAAMEKSVCIVTLATKHAGIDRKTHYRWMEKDAKYREEVTDLEEMALDFVESNLLKLIEKGDTAATIFYLKTKGKRRGYTERFEMDLGNQILAPLIQLLPPSKPADGE